MRRAASLVLAAVMACAVASGCDPAAPDATKAEPHPPAVETASAVGPRGATVPFAGGSLQVPSGALTETVDLHARPADAAASDALADVTQPLTPAVSLD